jgi:tRNA (guanine37-N1)-methyltransferase
MNFHIVTLFPEMFDSYLHESILGRAIKEKKISVSFINPRKFVTGKYKKVWPDGNISLQVDERPYGGGPGMIMMAEPVIRAIEKILHQISRSGRAISKNKKSNSEEIPACAEASAGRRGPQKSFQNLCPKILIINFIPKASKFTTALAKNFSKKYTDIIMICGRYEGIDARVDKILKTKAISIGDYVLTGGEIPAMVLMDSISRQIEGVLGNFNSREEERISSSEVYTRPEVLIYNNEKYRVPKVLLSGNHKKINEWKKKNKN